MWMPDEEGTEEQPRPIWTREDFLMEDKESNITIENGVIKAATFPKLVSKLTFDNPGLLKEFLLTHRSFTKDGIELLNALRTRFESAHEVTDNPDDHSLIKFKTLNVLKNWLEHFSWDFFLDCPDIATMCYEWLAEIQEKETGALAKTAVGIKAKLDIVVSLKERSNKTKGPTADAPKPHIPKDTSAPILEEIARQMTLVEWKLWCSIHPFEFLNLSWTKKDRDHRAPNIMMSINHFNYVSNWVTTTVLTCEKPKDRQKTIAKWIDIAQRLQLMGNLNGMMEVISGPVHRLKLTFAQLQAKESKLYNGLQTMLNNTRPNNSYALLRKMLLSFNPPVIPYLGMYLTDLTFIEEGNKDYVTDYQLINFYKRRLLCNTLTDIQNYQHIGYNFVEIPSMAWEIMYGSENKTEEELYEVSLVLEPRSLHKAESISIQKSNRSGSLSFIPSPKKLLAFASSADAPTQSQSSAPSPRTDRPSWRTKSSVDVKSGVTFSPPSPISTDTSSSSLVSSSSQPELRKAKSTTSIKDKYSAHRRNATEAPAEDPAKTGQTPPKGFM